MKNLEILVYMFHTLAQTLNTVPTYGFMPATHFFVDRIYCQLQSVFLPKKRGNAKNFAII